MAKTWYPVIDYTACVECGTCVNFCPHGVFDREKAPSPTVINPISCVDHCHNCGNKCPMGAIVYVGDDTGWIPPHGEKHKASEPCCSCGCRAATDKKVLVEYLYLDLNTCERCIGTDKVLDEVMATITAALELAGYDVEYEKTKMVSADMAVQYQFLSSPTIRVNGQDICSTVTESSCGCCSNISSTDVDCRVFEYRGKSYEVPPKEMLAEAILKAVFSKKNDCSCGNYELPENLRRFFEGKEEKDSKCSCGGKCC